ncbi:MAG: hypothetical protein WA825_11985 [Steroidobacteraceae bacterium]
MRNSIKQSLAALLVSALGAMANTAYPAIASGAGDTESTAPAQTVQVYDIDYPFINYSGRPVHNEIARLQQRIDRGEVKLTYGTAHGYLESLLAALNISPSSQALVFSKTSLQIEAITPQTPRAIYFNDDTYIGWIASSGLLEVVTMDADRGPVFYTLANTDRSGAHLQRETLRCLTCHDSYSEMGGGVPYFLFESTYRVEGREVLPEVVARETSEATPIAERWGGWYVTGNDNGLVHLGNILADSVNTPAHHERAYRGSLQTLSGMFDTSRYLTDKSDLVSLLVLDHQVSVHNMIIHANFKSRVLLAKERPDALAADGTAATALHWRDLSASTQLRLSAMIEPLVRGMLMMDAAPLLRPVSGTSGYSAQFEARGPFDPQGRSLRDLDLKSRVFRYPMSFLIYSEGFDSLPQSVRDHVYQRFMQILMGRDSSGAYKSLAPADRQAVLEILQATKPDFARALDGSP